MPACQSWPRSFQNVRAISVGLGSRNSWTWNATTRPCQAAIPSTKTSSAGAQSATRRPTAAAVTAASPRDRRIDRSLQTAERATPARPEFAVASAGSGRPLRELGLELRAAAGEPLPHLGHELEEARLLARARRARVRQGDLHDPPGSARGGG